MTGARPPAAVTGAGVRTPIGADPEALWAAVCAGSGNARPYRDERLPADASVVVSLIDGFDPTAYLTPVEVRRYDRTHHLAVAAAQDALDERQSGGAPLPAPERCAVVCGVGFGATATYEDQHVNLVTKGLRALSPLSIPLVMPNASASLLSMRFGFRGPCLTVSTACASGATAIGEGLELLRRGAADLVVAGGVDAMVNFNALCSFLRLDAMSRNVADPEHASRPFDVDRDGFVMGEGAGFVVLERAVEVDADGRPSRGRITGYATTADAHHLVAPSPDGEGALRCMALALSDAGLAPADVAQVNAHGTSTPLNDLAEGRALTALFAAAVPPVTAVKGATGHLIAGSGAVEAIVALWSARTGVVPPVAGLRTVDPAIALDVVSGTPRQVGPGPVLSNAFGFGGTNAVLVVEG